MDKVTEELHHNAFEVKPYNWSDGATHKYKATELYLPTTIIVPLWATWHHQSTVPQLRALNNTSSFEDVNANRIT